MEHYYDKGLLEWFDGGLAPPHPRIVLNKQSGPEQWDIWKLAANTRRRKNLKLGPGISQGPVVVIVTISFATISHILYRPVSHFLLLQPQNIYNLIRLLHSVTCINCKLYTCLNSSISLSYSILCYSCSIQSQCLQLGKIKFHLQNIHNNDSLNVQLLQKKIFKTFSKNLPSSPNLETLAEQSIRARPTKMVSKYYPQYQVWNCNFGDCLDNLFVVYHRLSIRLVNTNQTHLVRIFFLTNIIKQGELSRNI